jgi:hypothetical protein
VSCLLSRSNLPNGDNGLLITAHQSKRHSTQGPPLESAREAHRLQINPHRIMAQADRRSQYRARSAIGVQNPRPRGKDAEQLLAERQWQWAWMIGVCCWAKPQDGVHRAHPCAVIALASLAGQRHGQAQLRVDEVVEVGCTLGDLEEH